MADQGYPQTGQNQPSQQQPQPQPSQPQYRQPYPQPQQGYQQPAQYRQPYQQPQAYQQQTQYQQPAQYQPVQPQGMEHAPPPITERPGHHIALVVAAIIVVIFISAGVFYMLPGEEVDFKTTEYEAAPLTQIPAARPTQEQPRAAMPVMGEREVEFGVKKFVFAYLIHEDFRYEPNPDATYFVMEAIYLYFEPEGFEKTLSGGQYLVNIVEDLEVRDPSGNLIDYLTVPAIATATSTRSGEVAFRNSLLLDEDAPAGTYTVTIKLKDLLGGKESTHTETFIIEDYPYDISA